MHLNSADEFIDMREPESADCELRWATADPQTWFAILDAYPEHDEEVALNKRLPDAVAHRLAQSRSWRVRSAVVEHHRTPISVLRRLAADPNEFVRSSVAHHRHVPRDVLESMLEDASWPIRDTARERLDELDDRGEL